ncbi:MAG: PAS domain-containing protein, partial [Alphaproteobacteria bacterium]
MNLSAVVAKKSAACPADWYRKGRVPPYPFVQSPVYYVSHLVQRGPSDTPIGSITCVPAEEIEAIVVKTARNKIAAGSHHPNDLSDQDAVTRCIERVEIQTRRLAITLKNDDQTDRQSGASSDHRPGACEPEQGRCTVANPKTEADPDRRQLHQLISGLRDGIILLGLDQRVLWANEAALKMHGAGRIEELGCDVDDYRKRFRLTYRNKQAMKGTKLSIEGVLAGEPSEPIVVDVRLDGEPDQTRVHALRFQVIVKDDGEPDFVVLIVEDETARYDAEERFESAFNANPAPAMICRISDQRHVRVNRGFLDMTGFSQDDVIGRTASEFDILAGSRGRDEAMERLREGRTIPQNESDLTLPDGSTKCVIVAGQRIELNDEPCM